MLLIALAILYNVVLLAVYTMNFWLTGCLSAWITCLFKTVVDYFKTQRKLWRSVVPNSVIWVLENQTSERWWGNSGS